MVCYNKAWYGIYKAWYGIYTRVQKCGISEVPILLSSSSLLNYRVWWVSGAWWVWWLLGNHNNPPYIDKGLLCLIY